MGYYTNYTLNFIEGEYKIKPCEHEYPKDAKFCPSCGIATDGIGLREKVIELLDEGYGNPFEDSNKWYEHETDMLAISAQFPTVVFALKGEGEEPGDIWMKYFKDGKMQVSKPEIVFDEYDESKLS